MSTDDRPVSDAQIDAVAGVAARLVGANSRHDAAVTTLDVAEGELAKAHQRGDQVTIADAKAEVAKQEVAVADANVAVAVAKVAVADPGQQETAKSVLVQAIRGLSIAQDAYQRALSAGWRSSEPISAHLSSCVSTLEACSSFECVRSYGGLYAASVPPQ